MNNATPGMKNDQSKIKETNCKLAALKKKDQQTQSEDKSETDQFSPYSFQVLEGKKEYNFTSSLKNDMGRIRLRGGAPNYKSENLNEAFIEERKQEKKIYSVNCSLEAVIQLFNFMRSFNFLWISMDHHLLCNMDQACFFCNMRSSCLRLRQTREKGPKGLQLKEFVSHLSQYDSKLGWNWKTKMDDVPKFIEKTLELMMKSGPDIRSHFAMPLNTQHHNEEGKDGFIIRVNLDSNQDGEQTLSIEEILNK